MIEFNSNIHFILTGGTITKSYVPPSYADSSSIMYNRGDDLFLIGRILETANLYEDHITIDSIMSKDSNDIVGFDLVHHISDAIKECPDNRVIVVCGTDFMGRIADDVGIIPGKTVVFVGSLVPCTLRESDAQFNLGGAVMAARLLPEGTYIAMNGNAIPIPAVKDWNSKKFKNKTGEE